MTKKLHSLNYQPLAVSYDPNNQSQMQISKKKVIPYVGNFIQN
jgi:hypothetical protein